MDSINWLRIQKNWVYLLQNLETENLLPFLYQEHVISDKDKERVEKEVYSDKQRDKLLKILKTKESGYNKLCEGLRQRQPFIVEKLEQTIIDDKDAEKLRMRDKLCGVLLDHFCVAKHSSVELRDILKVVEGMLGGEIEKGILIDIVSETFVDVNHVHENGNNRFDNLYQRRFQHVQETISNYTEMTQVKKFTHVCIPGQRKIQYWDSSEVCQMLRERIPSKKELVPAITTVTDTFAAEKISGDVFINMTKEDIKEIFPKLTFGERASLLLLRDEIVREENNISLNAAENTNEKSKKNAKYREKLRKFDTAASASDTYVYGAHTFTSVTRCYNLIEPIHFFKHIDCESQGDYLTWIQWETLKIAAACMNDRTNGTIHFGILPLSNDTSDEGRICGISLKKEDVRRHLQETIHMGFDRDQLEMVLKCIREPQFIDVVGSTKAGNTYVFEIDVVPHSKVLGVEVIFVNMSSCGGHTLTLFRCKDESISQADGNEVIQFMKTKDTLLALRRDQERLALKAIGTESDLRDKFVHLLTDGNDATEDLYPILFLSPLDSSMDKEYIKENITFIESLDPNIIFDFDFGSDRKGLYEYIEHEREQVLKVLTTDNFEHAGKDMFEDLQTSGLKPWVFCNGYEVLGQQLYSLLKWKQCRSEGFKEGLRFYKHQIPEGRAIVIFCLFSKTYEVMLEAAEEALIKFQNQWMVIAESDSIANYWISELLRRKSIEKGSVQRRFVLGMPWKHVSQTIIQTMGKSESEITELPTSTGAFCHLKEKIKNEMVDLSILSRCECDNSEIAKDSKIIEKNRKKLEEEFFRGHCATWWNFWFGDDHVLKRDKHDSLMKMVRSTLEGDIDEDEKIGLVYLYHQPGAGGSTTARHVLWELRKEYRCCIVKRITDETYEHIALLRRYDEPEDPKPVVVLIDNEDEDKVNTLHSQLDGKARHVYRQSKKPFKLFCLLLLCLRKTNLSKTRNRDKERKTFILLHDLTQREIAWFHRKSELLEQKHKIENGVDPRLLISFNLMKSNFDADYINRSVEAFCDEVMDKNERLLLKFLSLMNAFDQDFQPVPVSAFDTIMHDNEPICFGLVVPQQQRPKRSWESKISDSLKVLLNRTSRAGLGGQIKAFCIINQLFASEILQYILKDEKKSVSQLTMELLKSDIFKLENMSRDLLVKTVRDILKKRAVKEDGTFEKFSAIVNVLMEKESPDIAVEVLKTGFEMTNDPMIAQTLSRLFIHCKNWPEAINFAKRATTMLPQNSFLWDTYGQVYKDQVYECYRKCLQTGEKLGLNKASEIIRAAFDAIDKFKQEQAVSEIEKTISQNKNGYYGEMKVTVMLLELFSYFSIYTGEEEFHRFLVDSTYIPTNFECLGDEIIQRMKSLQENVENTMRLLEEKQTQVKDDCFDVHRRQRPYPQNDSFIRMREDLDSFFGEDDGHIPENLSPKEKHAYRSRRIIRLGGRSLSTLLQLRRLPDREKCKRFDEIVKLSEENVKSNFCRESDYRSLLGAVVAMTVFRVPTERKIDHKVILELAEKLFDISDSDDRPYLETFLFKVMLHWPTENRKEYQLCPIGKLLDAIRRWRKAFHSNHQRQKEDAFGAVTAKKDTVFFFLGNGEALDEILYYEDLGSEENGSRLGDRVWESPQALQKLQRLTGTLINDGNDVQIQVESSGGNKSVIIIPTSMTIRQRSLFQKRVFFVLGFGWSGPKAYNVTANDPSIALTPRGRTASNGKKQTKDECEGESSASSGEISPRRGTVSHSLIQVDKKQYTYFSQRLQAIDGEIEELKTTKDSKTRKRRMKKLKKERDKLVTERTRLFVEDA
ncbi:hypothetical protein CHS0354_031585 [Potamilus streckersoni]|uniref:CARD domain-containing protein n=1 Tax=Potamilus streckersoni TaxID=2493646 RepID=A0AAE0VVG7_9BIVA|nr:hypothetical protein CHS0354_031585 [Potamilus streckersoni]